MRTSAQIKATSFSFFIFVCSLAFPIPTFAKDIAILISDELPVYQQAVQGFRSGLSPDFRLQEFLLGQSFIDDREIGRQVRASNPDLVLVVGRKAALLAKLEILDQPVVFCLVLNPEKDALPTPNMTGIRMTVPSHYQLASMKTVLPTLQRVGLLYDKNGQTSFVRDAQLSAQAVGLTLVALPVQSHEEIPDNLRTLLPQVDAFWLLRDPMVVNAESLRFLMQTTLEQKVPVFGFSSGLMRHGALATLSLDYQQIGQQAARLSRDILRGHFGKNSLPAVQNPELPQLALNLNAADYLAVTPSAQSMQLASQLFGGPGAFAKKESDDLLLP